MPEQAEDSLSAEVSGTPGLSVVIPVHNESGAILPLLAEVTQALDGVVDYEILVVDDASSDGTMAQLADAGKSLERLRVLRHGSRSGQSAGLLTGIRGARAPWIATLDGDGQNDPADIPRLWRHRLEHPQARMLCGSREERKDSTTKRLASRIANGVRRRFLHDGVTDSGCGLKLFRRDLFLELPAFDHMHRFLPALALAAGATIETLPVGHRPRKAGKSKYGILDRLAEGLLDILGVWWLIHRRIKPETDVPSSKNGR